MIIWTAMLVPTLTAIILAVLFRKKVTWWEYLLMFAVPAMLIGGVKVSVEAAQVRCTEYWGAYLTEANYYEDWNEYIHKICSESYPCGTDSEGNTTYCTRFYDCSYVDYHPEYWEVENSIGESFRVSKNYFEDLCKMWNNRTFVDMARNFHTDDGDAYTTKFDKEPAHLIPTTTEHIYENRVQASHSVFNFREFKKGEASALGLYDHPPVKGFTQNCILGPWASAQDEGKGEKAIAFLNAVFGKPSKVRVYLLLWMNKPLSISHEQEAYWKGGNKNEVVVCVGVDPSYTPQWARVFGWTKNETLKIEVRNRIMSQKKLDVVDLAHALELQILGKTIRRDFREFSYLTVDPPMKAVIWTFVLTFIVCGLLGWFVVGNEIDVEKE